MDLRLLIGITIVALILVFAGEDPYETKRQEEEIKYKGEKDPLMRAIMDYQNEKPYGKEARGTGKAEAGSSVSRSESVKGAQPHSYPDHMIPHQNRKGTWQLQKDREQYAPPTENNGINNNNYYPPPPTRDDSRRGSSNQLGIKPIPVAEMHKFLRGGQPIAYEGTKVFYIDAQGNKKRMPNGRYHTADGMQLHIVDGKKFIGSN
jgi:hypothetical protein